MTPDSPPTDEASVSFTLDRHQSVTHYGAKLTFTGSGHTFGGSGAHVMIVNVQLERNGETASTELASPAWKHPVELLGVKFQVDEADGFDPKRATFKMFRPE